MNDSVERPTRAPLEGLVGEIFKLVSRGAPPEQWAEWLRVPLEHAAADGNIDLFSALIGAGADGSAGWRGCEGRTLFHAAAVGGNAEVVSGLVTAGAQPDVNVVLASSGLSALHMAASLGHEDAARRLLSAGANVRHHGVIIMEAVKGGCEELVNDLLMAGASPSIDGFREPLHIAAELGFEGITSALLGRGANKDALDGFGDSPLTLAAGNGHLAVVNSLLAAGADVEMRVVGLTALDFAAQDGHVGILKAILGHGADVNAVDHDGDSALHHAAAYGKAGAIDVLIEAGADTELKNLDEQTPLCSAAYENELAAMRALLHLGAKADVRGSEGNTLLHTACRRQNATLDSVVDLLLQSGADEAAVNNDGKTPASMLESHPDWGPRCSPDELERARLLLARAPNERAWRRRSWLVMLRSRASRARIAGYNNRGVSENGPVAEDGRGESRRSKMAKSENAEGGESGVVWQAGVIGLAGEDGGLGAVVSSLIGLELEGVFRTVVSFL